MPNTLKLKVKTLEGEHFIYNVFDKNIKIFRKGEEHFMSIEKEKLGSLICELEAIFNAEVKLNDKQ